MFKPTLAKLLPAWCLFILAITLPQQILAEPLPERLTGKYSLEFLDFTSGSGLLPNGIVLEFVIGSAGSSLCVAGFELTGPEKNQSDEYTWLESSIDAELKLSQFEAGRLFEIALTAGGIRQGAFSGTRTGPGGSCGERNMPAIDLLFLKAEQRFPDLFNPLENAQTVDNGELIYRSYSSTGITLSVDKDDFVYISGGSYGPTPVLVNELFEVIYQLDALFEGWTLVISGTLTEGGGPPIIVGQEFENVLPPADPSNLFHLGDILQRTLAINNYESGMGTDFGTQIQSTNRVRYSMRFNAQKVNGLESPFGLFYELTFDFQR